jgi:hypothetical protein
MVLGGQVSAWYRPCEHKETPPWGGTWSVLNASFPGCGLLDNRPTVPERGEYTYIESGGGMNLPTCVVVKTRT